MRSLMYINPQNASITLDDSLYGITKLEGLDLPPVLLFEQKSPFQHGATSVDQLYDVRDVMVEGIIACGGKPATIYAYRRAFEQIVNPILGPGTLIYKNDFGTWQLNSVTPEGGAPLFPNRNANEGSQKYVLTFHCADPFLYDLVAQTVQLQTVVNLIAFNPTMAFVSGGIALAKYTGAPVACYNQGDAPTPVQITITGPCTNPKLTKTSTGEYIRIIKTLASGDVLTIDTSMGKKTVYFTAAGGSPVNAIANLDLSSTMFSLDLGYNAMQLTDDASSTSKLCTVQFTNRYGGA